MGRTARTLILVVAAVAFSAFGAVGFAMAEVKVRVEGTGGRASPNALLPRKAVTPAAPYTSTDGTHTCATDSALAALDTAVSHYWDGTFDATTGKLKITSILGVAAPTGPTPAWGWTAYVDEAPAGDPCTTPVPAGTEALFFPQCTDRTDKAKVQATCYPGGPLYGKVNETGELYPMAPVSVSYYKTPVGIYSILAEDGKVGPSTKTTVTTDENGTTTTNDERGYGVASVFFTNGGPHRVTLTQAGKVPVTVPLCATDGGDGFCGSGKTTPPDEIPYPPSPCDTNGHDGACGTVDTSGPVTNVTNIKDKQSFAKTKAPGQVKGTIAVDPASVKDVLLRVTRTSTARVRLKAKKVKKGHKKPKPRYRTVKRCSRWNDDTALFETMKCTTKAKWFPASLDDLVQNFSYNFALRLPPGTYRLEVASHDLDNNVDAPAPGRNVIAFTVKSN
jgi:hypothetical protein